MNCSVSLVLNLQLNTEEGAHPAQTAQIRRDEGVEAI